MVHAESLLGYVHMPGQSSPGLCLLLSAASCLQRFGTASVAVLRLKLPRRPGGPLAAWLLAAGFQLGKGVGPTVEVTSAGFWVTLILERMGSPLMYGQGPQKNSSGTAVSVVVEPRGFGTVLVAEYILSPQAQTHFGSKSWLHRCVLQ